MQNLVLAGATPRPNVSAAPTRGLAANRPLGPSIAFERATSQTTTVKVRNQRTVVAQNSVYEGIPGTDVQLTIDAHLQSYVEARMAGESAAAVVIDCASGDLIAVGNAPSFDPNLFVRGISVLDWTSLNENIYRPLAAKAVQGAYPPGSTFKMTVGLAALEAGVIDPEETVYCPGFTVVSGTRFHRACLKRAKT